MSGTIGELFEKDPKRHIIRVTSVQESKPEIVYEELDDYVVTPAIRQDLGDILDRLIESRRSPSENVCAWISGFFGSGKSLFLKVLGSVIANVELKSTSGDVVRAAPFFLGKHSFSSAQTAILTRQLHVMSIFVHMLDQDVRVEASTTQVVYSELLRKSGLSEVPWIAEIERTIQARGLWERFLENVRETEGQPWEKVRRLLVRARPVLARALQSIDPKTYASVEEAGKSIEDQEKSFQLKPSLLVERLLEKARELDPVEGRIALCLDEVGLYIGNDSDRLADLNILAEHISKFGQGKIWLFVTAQEALEAVIARLESVTGQFAKIRDRFQIMVKLTPENIDRVVKERLLQKTADSSKLEILRRIYKKNDGMLWTGALPSGIVAGRDYLGLFSGQSEDRFLESYPFMPYHIYLMQEIFDILRSRGGPAQALTGKERTVLSVVATILSGIKDRKGLADMPVGQMATFDMVYDTVDEELKAIRSMEGAAIGQRIAHLGKKGDLSVSSVAKVIYLLQGIKWFPSSSENIAVLLYPSLGYERNRLLGNVKDCISVLETGLWVREDSGTYKFLTEFERTFEQMVESKRQELSGAEKRQLIQEAAKTVLIDENKFNRIVHNSVPFDVKIISDDTDLNTKGTMELQVFSPFRSREKGLIPQITLLSRGQQGSMYWICSPDQQFEELVERAICIEKVLADFKPQTDSDRQVAEEQIKALRILKEDRLPQLFAHSASSGKVIYQGETFALDGKKGIQEIYKTNVEEAIEEVFTEFDLAPYNLERDPEDVLAILKWRQGVLPRIYKELKLIDDQNTILTASPVPSRIIGRLKDASLKQEDRTGGALADHFASPPFGWDGGVVKLVLATLVKNGSAVILSGGRELSDPPSSSVQEIFKNQRAFNKAEFRIGEEEVPVKERLEASKLLSEFFGLRAEAPEEIDEALVPILNEKLAACEEILRALNLIGLSAPKGLGELQSAINRIKSESSRRRRIQAFVDKTNAGSLRDNLELLSKMTGFQKRGNFVKYQEITRFSRDIAPQLLSTSADDETRKLLESLNAGLKADDLVDRWSGVVGSFDKLSRRYRKVYAELHSERHDLLKEALTTLRAHPGYRSLGDKEKESIVEPLTTFDCQAEKFTSDSSYSCEKCGSSLEGLSLQISKIEGIRNGIESQLDKAVVRKSEARKPVQFGEVVSSRAQVSRVTKRIDEVAREAFSLGKSLRIDVKEAQDGGQGKEG